MHTYSEVYKLPSTSRWSKINVNDIALITGGSRGLGLEIVKELILTKNIGKVIILDLVEPEFQFTATYEKRLEFIKCDVGNEKTVLTTMYRIINTLNNEGKYISICINNAGIRHNESLLHLPQDRILKIFNVNTMSHIWILRAILNNHILNVHMKKENNRLFIVSVSSILGTLAPKNLSIYSASKAAIIQIHEALTQEVSYLPLIRLLLVATGQLTTTMFHDVTPPRQFFAPIVNHYDLAKSIVNKIEKGEKGVLCNPLYANFLPLVKCMPIFVQDFCRWISGMDNQIKDSHTN